MEDMDLYKLEELLDDKIKEINDANTAYRLGDEIMSDTEFDELVDEAADLQSKLKTIDPKHRLMDWDARRIGVSISDSDSRKEKLPIQMASMNKLKSFLDISEWIDKSELEDDDEVVLTPKYDGIALCEDVEFSKAWTRGDGVEGQKSDDHLKRIGDAYPKSMKVYTFGEVIMPRDVFETKYSFDALGEDRGYANGRNLVAGKMNDKNPSEILEDCNFIRFGMLYKDEDKSMTKVQQLEGLNRMNTVKVPYEVKKVSEIDDKYLIGLFKKWREDYEIDGVIIDVNDPDIVERLGRDAKGNPQYARAYKNPNFAESKTAKIIGIEWNVSKQGLLKPVIQVNPVKLDGATVRNVTGINAKFIKALGIKIGEEVVIKRSGMVIPQVVEIEDVIVPIRGNFKTQSQYDKALEEAAKERSHVKADLPTECPSSGGLVRWTTSEVDLYSENSPAQKLQKAVAFFVIMGVDNVGEGVVQAFFDAGFDSAEKILNMKKSDMASVPRFGKRKADKVYSAIKEKTTDATLSKVQHASGFFDGLGSKKLVLLENLDNPTKEDIVEIDGFAEKSADVYLEGLPDFNNFLSNVPISIKAGPSSDKYEDLVVAFTNFRNSDWEESIEDGGGKVGGLSKKTTVLVAADPNGSSGKIKKAKDYGTEIMSPDDFEAKYGPFELPEKDIPQDEEEEDEVDNQLNLF